MELQREITSLAVPKEANGDKNDYRDLLSTFSSLLISDAVEMSQEEALDLRTVDRTSVARDLPYKTVLSDEEKTLLRRARQLLEKCLQLHKQAESDQRLVTRRAIAFIALYSQRAGKDYLQNAVSSLRSFRSFLVLICAMARQFLRPSSDYENHEIRSRGPVQMTSVQAHAVTNKSLAFHTANYAGTFPGYTSFGQMQGSFDHAPSNSLDDDDELPQEVLTELHHIFVNGYVLPDLSEEMDLDDLLNDPPSCKHATASISTPSSSSTPLYAPSPTDSFPPSPTGSVQSFTPSLSPLSFSDRTVSSLYPLNSSPSGSPLASPSMSLTSGRSSTSTVELKVSTMALNVRDGPQFSLNKNFNSSFARKPADVAVNGFATAKDELLSHISRDEQEQSLLKIATYSDELLLQTIKADEDGDTGLMVACANPKISLSDLYQLTERLKKYPYIFRACNRKRQNALHCAVTNRRDKPYIAGYVAETMVSLDLPLNQTFDGGNTIVHVISLLGDDYASVLPYILRIKTRDGRRACDLNAFNHDGCSALHEAVMKNSPQFPCREVIHHLLNLGADATLKDCTSGKTAVHYAVEKRDYEILHLLLTECPEAANARGCNENTPLHTAAAFRLGVSEQEQLTVVQFLLHLGADKTLRNKANKLPIELVPLDRQKVKQVLLARQRN